MNDLSRSLFVLLLLASVGSAQLSPDKALPTPESLAEAVALLESESQTQLAELNATLAEVEDGLAASIEAAEQQLPLVSAEDGPMAVRQAFVDGIAAAIGQAQSDTFGVALILSDLLASTAGAALESIADLPEVDGPPEAFAAARGSVLDDHRRSFDKALARSLARNEKRLASLARRLEKHGLNMTFRLRTPTAMREFALDEQGEDDGNNELHTTIDCMVSLGVVGEPGSVLCLYGSSWGSSETVSVIVSGGPGTFLPVLASFEPGAYDRWGGPVLAGPDLALFEPGNWTVVASGSAAEDEFDPTVVVGVR